MENLYFVVMDWYDGEGENQAVDAIEQKIIPVFGGDLAINLAHDIAYVDKVWKNYNRPNNVYLYKVDLMQHNIDFDNQGWTDNDGFLAAYFECNKNLKD